MSYEVTWPMVQRNTVVAPGVDDYVETWPQYTNAAIRIVHPGQIVQDETTQTHPTCLLYTSPSPRDS